jgi:hypothetical protein
MGGDAFSLAVMNSFADSKAVEGFLGGLLVDVSDSSKGLAVTLDGVVIVLILS